MQGVCTAITRVVLLQHKIHCEVAVLFRKPHCAKLNRFCDSCHKTGHTEEKCWPLGSGRPKPYFI